MENNDINETIKKIKESISAEFRNNNYKKLDDFFSKEKMSLDSIIIASTDFISSVLYGNLVLTLQKEKMSKEQIEEKVKKDEEVTKDIILNIRKGLLKVVNTNEVNNMQVITALCFILQNIIIDSISNSIKELEKQSNKE